MMQRIVLAQRPKGAPVDADFRLETLDIPTPGAGEVLVAVSHLSLDPYMRGRMEDVKSYAPSVNLGETMTGQGVGTVLASNDEGFAEGDLVTGITGWVSHAVLPGAELRKLDAGLPPTSALGVLGMPGFTAWVGLRKYARLAAGETLVVAAATGPVGSMVGQIARAAGLRTVAIAGGAEKCRLATEMFGFDAAIDHHAYDTASDLRNALAQAAPNGVDVYWENVGGKVLEAVLPLMNTHGRIPLCGTIAWYSGLEDSPDRLPALWRATLVKRLSINGLIVFDHWGDYAAFLAEMTPKVLSGEIAYLEDITQGLAQAPAAFMALLTGGNTGKAIVAI